MISGTRVLKTGSGKWGAMLLEGRGSRGVQCGRSGYVGAGAGGTSGPALLLRTHCSGSHCYMTKYSKIEYKMTLNSHFIYSWTIFGLGIQAGQSMGMACLCLTVSGASGGKSEKAPR